MLLMSLNASSGRAEMSKFSLTRAAVVVLTSKAVPRRAAHANSTCAGVTIKVTITSIQRVSDNTLRHASIGNQGAKAEYGHQAGPAVERDFRGLEIRRFDHDD